VVDTCGLLLVVLVTGAGVQDRDAARLLLWALRTCVPTVRLLWADGGYCGRCPRQRWPGPDWRRR
jgi:putative transposase